MTDFDPPLARTLCENHLPLRLWDWGASSTVKLPPVLMVHGFLDTGRSWDAVARQISDFSQPLALDWRGHGESGRATRGASYHQLDHLKDLTRAMDELSDAATAQNGPLPRTLVAHSMGATIALLYSGLLPEALDHLILLDNLGGFAKDAEDNIDRLSEVLDSVRKPKRAFQFYASKAEAAAHVRRNNRRMTDQGIERFLDGALTQEEQGLRFCFDRELRGPNPLSFPESHWVELCSRVQAKVHVLVPEYGYYPKTNGAMDARLEALQDGSKTWLAKTSHHIHVDRPNAVAKAVKDILSA